MPWGNYWSNCTSKNVSKASLRNAQTHWESTQGAASRWMHLPSEGSKANEPEMGGQENHKSFLELTKVSELVFFGSTHQNAKGQTSTAKGLRKCAHTQNGKPWVLASKTAKSNLPQARNRSVMTRSMGRWLKLRELWQETWTHAAQMMTLCW